MEVILEFLRRSYLVFHLLTVQKIYLLNTTIDYFLSSKRFDVPLTNFWFVLQHLRIENMSFKFYYLNAKSFTTFLPYYVIGLGMQNLLYLAN